MLRPFLFISALGAGLVVLLSSPVHAASVEVTWQEPESYRDIRAAEESQNRFQARVFDDLEKHFALLAKRLPEDQKLSITVTDLDLAGEVTPENIGGSLRLVRVVRSADFPSITFSYVLTDAEGRVVSEGNERLRGRDLPGQGRPVMRSATSQLDALAYERAMLDRWFRFRFELND